MTGLRRVLVATDFTTGAAAALPRALLLPLAPGAQLELVHVLPAELPRRLVASVRADVAASLDAALAAAQRLAARAGLDVALRPRIESGRPVDALLARARTSRAELLVLGRHGRRVVRDLFIGSTARRLAHRSPIPVLVANHAATVAYRRPLVGVDLTHQPDALVATTRAVLGERPLTVRLVHAFQVPFEGMMRRGMSAAAVKSERAAFRRQARAAMNALCARHQGGALVWKQSVRRGDPRSVILSEAAQRRADLVVIGSRGPATLLRALVGGVAETVIDAAPGDVLVVPPPPR